MVGEGARGAAGRGSKNLQGSPKTLTPQSKETPAGRRERDDDASVISGRQSVLTALVDGGNVGPRAERAEYALNLLFARRFCMLLKLGWDRYCMLIALVMMAIAYTIARVQNDFLTPVGAVTSTVTMAYLSARNQMESAGLCREPGISALGQNPCEELRLVAKRNLWDGGWTDCFGGYPGDCGNEISRRTCYPTIRNDETGLHGCECTASNGSVYPCLGPCDELPTKCWPSLITDQLAKGQTSANLPIVWWWFMYSVALGLSMAVAMSLGDALNARIRRNLTLYLNDLVLRRRYLYRLVTEETDIDNYDQRISEDIEYFFNNSFAVFLGCSNQSSHLFYTCCLSYFGLKASIDGLMKSSHTIAYIFMGCCLFIIILTYCVYILPINYVARVLFNQKGYEGDFRFCHSRIVDQAESVCLYNGEKQAKAVADARFSNVFRNYCRLSNFQSVLYAFNVGVSSIPAPLSSLFVILGKVRRVDTLATQGYVSNGVGSMANICNIISYTSKGAGPCHRIGILVERLRALEAEAQIGNAGGAATAEPPAVDLPGDSDVDSESFLSFASDGEGGGAAGAVELRHASVAAPGSARPLVANLSLRVRHGERVCIVGPSGSGKTAVLRLLARMWAPAGGAVGCPGPIGRGGAFFIPQRPYATAGTLREQVTYPRAYRGACAAEDALLVRLLRDVELTRLAEQWPLDAAAPWTEMLSGGEMQRLGVARLLYHAPRFALLDEATSALDPALERRVLALLRARGMGLVQTSSREPRGADYDRVLHLGVGASGWRVAASGGAGGGKRDADPAVDDAPPPAATKAAEEEGGAEVPSLVYAFRGLGMFIRLTFPTWTCPAARWLYVSIVVQSIGAANLIILTRIDGDIINSLLEYDGGQGEPLDGGFWWRISVRFTFIIWSFGVVLGQCLSGMRLTLYLRAAITEKLHRCYFRPGVPYAVTTVPTVKLDTIDQRLVQDQALAVDYLQSVLFAGPGEGGGFKMGVMMGGIQIVIWLIYGAWLSWFGAVVVLCYIIAYLPINWAVAVPMGRATFHLGRAEGVFRFAHARLREFAESVRFLSGEQMEAEGADASLLHVYRRKLVVALAVFGPVGAGWVQGMVNGAVTSAALSYGVIIAQTGVPTESSDYSTAMAFYGGLGAVLAGWTGGLGAVGYMSGLVRRARQLLDALERADEHHAACTAVVTDAAGRVEADGLSLTTPASIGGERVLFSGVSFSVAPGDSLLITGPSGAGKSSLLRVLAGVWRPAAGALRRPLRGGPRALFFAPQRAYLPDGTLRGALLYPAAHDAGLSDDALHDVLRQVGLERVAARFSLDDEEQWGLRLSAGEVQRVGFARLLCHRPVFAVLDEATSLLDQESEERLMQLCVEAGTTFISVAHRESMRRWHRQHLHLDGSGGHTLSRLPGDDLPPHR